MGDTINQVVSNIHVAELKKFLFLVSLKLDFDHNLRKQETNQTS